MTDRTFHIRDAHLGAWSSTDRKHARFGWTQNDWETYNRLKHTLETVGFTFGPDPLIVKHYPILSGSHHLGQRPTSRGTLFVQTEVHPACSKFEFYQEVVTENRNGGRYDFDKRTKMPYLIGKAFDQAINAVRSHLQSRGFSERIRVNSANPDPLAYFNDHWDTDLERRNGRHRFERGPDGWPTQHEIGAYNGPFIPHGEIRYCRDHKGYLLRGRCYGGINGRWLVVYGPGPRDFTHRSGHELLVCDPRELPRRAHPNPKAVLTRLLDDAVNAEDFERAIHLRDALKVAA